jgi:hypothetical protein
MKTVTRSVINKASKKRGVDRQSTMNLRSHDKTVSDGLRVDTRLCAFARTQTSEEWAIDVGGLGSSTVGSSTVGEADDGDEGWANGKSFASLSILLLT